MADDGQTMPPYGYLSDENRGPPFLAFTIVMTVIGISSICIRFYARSRMPPSERTSSMYWWDDWVALSAVPWMLGTQALTFKLLHLGLGKHIWNVPPQNVPVALKTLYALYFVYDTALALLKASALLFYTRIFSTGMSPRWFRFGIHITHVINVGWFIGVVLGAVLMCDPISKYWNPWLEGKCGTTSSLWLGSAIPSVVIDVIILMLPLLVLWGLQLSKTRKLALTVIFICGYIVIVISIGRVVVTATQASVLESDLSYQGLPAMYWLIAEVPITMLSICLPTMSPLGRRIGTRFGTASVAVARFFGRRWNLPRKSSGDSGKPIREKSPRAGLHNMIPDFNAAGYRAYASHSSAKEQEADETSEEISIAPVEDNPRDGIRVKSVVTVSREVA